MEGEGKTGGQTDSSPPQHSALYLHDAFMVPDWGGKAGIQPGTMGCACARGDGGPLVFLCTSLQFAFACTFVCV